MKVVSERPRRTPDTLVLVASSIGPSTTCEQTFLFDVLCSVDLDSLYCAFLPPTSFPLQPLERSQQVSEHGMLVTIVAHVHTRSFVDWTIGLITLLILSMKQENQSE
jgi:hypothetical protein